MPLDMIAICCMELVASDPILSAEGPVFRRHVFHAEPELTYPCFLVTVMSFDETGKMSVRINVKPRIGVLYCFDQYTRDLATGMGQDEPSVGSLLAYILSVIDARTVSAYARTRFPGVASEQLAYFQNFQPVHPTPVEVAPGKVIFAVGVEAQYEYRALYPARTVG